VIALWESGAKQVTLFAALKQNLGNHKYKSNGEVDMVVT
jgi:hypothetical protein